MKLKVIEKPTKKQTEVEEPILNIWLDSTASKEVRIVASVEGASDNNQKNRILGWIRADSGKFTLYPPALAAVGLNAQIYEIE